MTNERHIPYFATSSLRKIINALKTNQKVTVLTAKSSSSVVNEIRKDDKIGFTENERVTNEVTIDYKGAGIFEDRLKTRMDEAEQHDISVSEIRIKVKVDEEIKDGIKRSWFRGDGRETDILEKISLSDMNYCYVDFENEKIDFDMNDFHVDQQSFKEFWSNINKCEVCSAPLEVHGFKHTTLNVKDIDFPWIKATLKRSQRPDIKPHVNVIASWIYQNIVKPTELGRMFNYRLGKEDQWILEGV